MTSSARQIRVIGSPKHPWLRSLPPSILGEKAAPHSIAELIEFDNHVYARLFTEWVRTYQPTAASSIQKLLTARLIAERPTGSDGLPWPDLEIAEANQNLIGLYEDFRDGQLAELCTAMRADGSGRPSRDFIASATEHLTISALDAQQLAAWLPLAVRLVQLASPVAAISLTLDRLAALQDHGWQAATTLSTSLSTPLLGGIWGMVEAELRRCLTVCAEQWPTGRLGAVEAAGLVEALLAYGELAEQTIFLLPAMCETALDWAREQTQLPDRAGAEADSQAVAELLAGALCCAEIATRMVAVALYACAPALAPLAAIATSAEGISQLISQLPMLTLPEHRSLRRIQVGELLGFQLLAAEHDQARAEAAHRELGEVATLLSALPNTPQSYADPAEVRQRLRILRGVSSSGGQTTGVQHGGSGSIDAPASGARSGS